MLNLATSKRKRIGFVVNKYSRGPKIIPENLLSAAKDGDISPVYLITGSDELSRERFFRKLTSCIVPDSVRDFNLNSFSLEGLDFVRFKSIYESYPIMSQRRVLILRDCDKLNQVSKDNLEEIFMSPIETSCVIFVSEKIDLRLKLFKEAKKIGSAIEFRIPYDKDLPKWIETQASLVGLKFDPKALLLLQLYVGNSPGELVKEIEKLAACVPDKVIVSEELVRQVTSNTRGVTVFELADAIGQKKAQEALNLLEKFLDGGNHPAVAVKMIARHYSILSRAKIELGKGNNIEGIAKVIGIHPYFARSYIDQARSNTGGGIWRSLSIIKDTDWQIRSFGRRLERVVMDRMIARLCTL